MGKRKEIHKANTNSAREKRVERQNDEKQHNQVVSKKFLDIVMQ